MQQAIGMTEEGPGCPIESSLHGELVIHTPFYIRDVVHPKKTQRRQTCFQDLPQKTYNCSQILDIGCVCLPFENNDSMESNPLVVKTTIVSSWFGTPLIIIFADYFAHILQDQNFSKTRCWVPQISHLLN